MTYLGEALLSIHEDGVPLGGMFHWGESGIRPYLCVLANKILLAMVDNAEWNAGISTR